MNDKISVSLETENKPILNKIKDKPILVSFSGGPDSVFLVLWLMSHFKSENLKLIYFNHGLRSEDVLDSEIKQNIDFAKKMGLSLMIKRIPVETYKNRYKVSLEAAGRYLRLSLLSHYAKLFNYSCVVMGHHLDDQCETFVSKLAKGLQSGHPGIRQEENLFKNCIVWRPLISLTKESIVSSLKKAGVQFVLDSSNEDRVYERNQIRLDLLPHFSSLNSNYQHSFKSFIDHQIELQKYFQYVLDPIFDLLREDDVSIKLPIGTLAPLDEFIRQRVIVHCLKRFQEIQQHKYRIRRPGFRLSQSQVQLLSQSVQKQVNVVVQLSINEHVKLTNTHLVCEEIPKKKLMEFTMDLPAVPGHYVLPELGKRIQLNLLTRNELQSFKSTDCICLFKF